MFVVLNERQILKHIKRIQRKIIYPEFRRILPEMHIVNLLSNRNIFLTLCLVPLSLVTLSPRTFLFFSWHICHRYVSPQPSAHCRNNLDQSANAHWNLLYLHEVAAFLQRCSCLPMKVLLYSQIKTVDQPIYLHLFTKSAMFLSRLRTASLSHSLYNRQKASSRLSRFTVSVRAALTPWPRPPFFSKKY